MEKTAISQESGPRRLLRILPLFFFFSGGSSLIFETIFTRMLTYTFGNTAHAVSTVLAAFLGGLAVGALVLGRWIDRRQPALIIYGVLELLVAVYCLFIPELFALLTDGYVALYHRFQLGSTALTVVRFGLSAVVILIPTILMGGTLPVLARLVAASTPNFEPEVDRLYAWNTLGAATGTLASTYMLMPSLGVRGAIFFACGVNLVIFLGVLWVASQHRHRGALAGTIAAEPPSPQEAQPSARRTSFLLLGAFLTGAVALAYEVTWTHVLAFLIGNTVYAFGIMLFTFLCGLGAGAYIVARRLRRRAVWARALAASQLFLGLSIFLTIPLWNRIPDIFAQGLQRALEVDILGISFLLLLRMSYVGWRIYRRPLPGRFPWSRAVELGVEALVLLGLLGFDPTPLWKYDATHFVASELLRFLCAFYLLIVPCLLLGLSFPLLLNLTSRTAGQAGSSVGATYAANTAGTIAGSVLTGFVVLPWMGSLETLRGAATINLALGLAFACVLVPLRLGRKVVLAVVTASLAVVFWLGPLGWDPHRMTRGSYVYFDRGWSIDRVVYFKEDIQGGLTSVVEVGQTRVMLSNGKFQGNNTGEVGAQIRFALIPMLFTHDLNRALVIGLGTGNTLRTVARFPFRQIDAIELAPHIVEAARLCFSDVNDLVFDRDPRVRLVVADGRNFLLLTRDRYDLITIEVSSIWISGEADLYNKEFYELCRARMTDRGVLQQWVQIHHMRTQDFLVILNTAAQVFPHLAFFQGPEQGLLIASSSPLECDYQRLAAFDAEPGVQHELAALRVPSMFSLLGELMLYGVSTQEALAQLPAVSGLRADFASTDFRPYLEYQTPKGNVVPYNTVPGNLRFMEVFRAPLLPPDLPVRNVPSEDEKSLLLGYVAEARGNISGALEFFARVRGGARERAERELGRIRSASRNEQR